MKQSRNNIVGVGWWVEGHAGTFYLLDPADPWSWWMFPILTLRAWRQQR